MSDDIYIQAMAGDIKPAPAGMMGSMSIGMVDVAEYLLVGCAFISLLGVVQ